MFFWTLTEDGQKKGGHRGLKELYVLNYFYTAVAIALTSSPEIDKGQIRGTTKLPFSPGRPGMPGGHGRSSGCRF